ncbi:NADH dehydrogenase [ubiquinone] 1 beta subcomplex subunit 3 [Hylobates moloch]|uniref:NADH dehydrogenase [ubiquinone] 1 beta subcomplex subunit 3 n=1 Tax=Hylobates moloch TaxID=81572 RepID=UPI002676C851|nr:NADH dehydrogenase [ubiquinone] 1 beta subcomplex subunit 3 [Hylobates moloch]
MGKIIDFQPLSCNLYLIQESLTQYRNVKRLLRFPAVRNSSNEAWRYMGGFAKSVSFFDVLFKGFKWGFAAFVVAVGAEYYLESLNKEKKHH